MGAPLVTVAEEIMKDSSIAYTAMDPVDLAKLHEIEAANEAPVTSEIMPESELVLAPDTLDEYLMPDTFADPHQLEKAGFTECDLLPVDRSRAFALQEDDFTIYAIVDGKATMCMDAIDIDDLPQSALLAIDRAISEAIRCLPATSSL